MGTGLRLLLVVVSAALAVGLERVGASWLAAIALAGSIAAGLWALRCNHPHGLALLPATTDLEGRPVPARWACHTCGAQWPAHFGVRPQTPVQRFSGDDQAKRVAAGKAADAHAIARRKLAAARTGVPPATPRTNLRAMPPTSERRA